MPMFQNNRLILSAGTLVNATFSERVTAANKAGFDAISLFPQQYLHARRKESLTADTMREILSELDVALDEVDPLLDWFSLQATRSEKLMMEMAQALGARSVNAAAAFVSDRSFDEIVDCYGRLCERVAKYGLRADLEFLPWTGVSNLTTALKVIEQADQPNAGVMFDFWHFFNSGEDLDVLRKLSAEQAARITSLQLNDVPRTISPLTSGQNWQYIKDMMQSMVDSIRVLGWDAFLNTALKARYPHPDAQKMMKDALCSRVFPGCGDMPVVEVLSILHDKGVQPAIGIEVFNLEHHAMSSIEVAQRAMQEYRKVLTD